MKKNLIFLSILLTTLFTFFIFLKGLDKKNIYIPKEIEGKKQVNFISKDFYTGQEIIFYNILKEKKFTILNIWSSWCLPCRKEHEFLVELSKKKNTNLIGLNYKDNKMNAKKFLENYGNPYSKILSDIDGTISIELGAYGVPETFIIDNKNKKVIRKYIGPLNQERLNDIRGLLN